VIIFVVQQVKSKTLYDTNAHYLNLRSWNYTTFLDLTSSAPTLKVSFWDYFHILTFFRKHRIE